MPDWSSPEAEPLTHPSVVPDSKDQEPHPPQDSVRPVQVQTPFWHDLFARHLFPHEPQFALSLFVSTHFTEHFVGVESEQSVTQTGLPVDDEQSGVVPEQAAVQLPQRALVLTSVSQSVLAESQFP